ncbi:MAG TPA: MbcA/ParS/Xre antitoxin family protein [Candidatus Baltobacteraceae bacterium]|nr:MbcA/ParS/Xre antitoxin family protein [Candidatus Baltobacteraceae bacterium]
MTASAALLRPSGVLDDSAGLSGPALRTFFSIAERWQLSAAERQRLLGLKASTYYKYQRDAANAQLSRDTLERISYILGIYKALQILLPRREAADAWIRRKNSAAVFNGHAPLDLMLAGRVSDLYLVRRYLDGERGW